MRPHGDKRWLLKTVTLRSWRTVYASQNRGLLPASNPYAILSKTHTGHRFRYEKKMGYAAAN